MTADLDVRWETDRDRVLLTYASLDLAATHQWAKHPEAGAVSSFCGTTRNNFQGRRVVRLEYEAYVEMAVKVMKELIKTIRTRYGDELLKIAVSHRLGNVPVLDESVIVVVSSVHRASGLEAARWIIDAIKEKVPIWKKEWYDDGTGKWKENVESCCNNAYK